MRTIIVLADWNSVLFWRDAEGQERIDDATFPISDESKRELNAYYGHFSALYLRDNEPVSDLEKRLLDDTGVRAWQRLRAELAGVYKVLFHSHEFACERIYSSGHMVAGWDGTFPRRSGRDPIGWFPEGRLLVF